MKAIEMVVVTLIVTGALASGLIGIVILVKGGLP